MSSPEPADNPAIACALSSGEMGERADLFSRLIGDAASVEEIEDGFALTLPGDDETTMRIFELVVAERRCCPFLRFELVLEPRQGPLRLRLRGPVEAKSILRPFFAQLAG